MANKKSAEALRRSQEVRLKINGTPLLPGSETLDYNWPVSYLPETRFAESARRFKKNRPSHIVSDL